MSLAHPAFAPAAAPRWLLLASLALNLFFIGVVGAIAVRGYVDAPAAPAPIDRTAAGRTERLAATLPAADADKLRAEFATRREPIEAAQANYRRMQDRIRDVLRREPFDVEAMRAAMTETRAARNTFELTLQAMIATAASEMSPEGRKKLAEWPPDRPR